MREQAMSEEGVNAQPLVYLISEDESEAERIAEALREQPFTLHAFDTSAAFLAHELSQTPSCLLVDVALTGSSGLDLCREILHRIPQPDCSIVFLSGTEDVATSVEAMKLGAIDYLLKPIQAEKLRETVALALHQSTLLCKIHQEEAQVAAAMGKLTPREKEILQGIGAGLLSKEIAKKLGISHRTVDVHRSHIMEKLRVESPTQLARIMCVLERRQLRFDFMHQVASVRVGTDTCDLTINRREIA
jgi:FixJ family two-component response regulator